MQQDLVPQWTAPRRGLAAATLLHPRYMESSGPDPSLKMQFILGYADYQPKKKANYPFFFPLSLRPPSLTPGSFYHLRSMLHLAEETRLRVFATFEARGPCLPQRPLRAK